MRINLKIENKYSHVINGSNGGRATVINNLSHSLSKKLLSMIWLRRDIKCETKMFAKLQ